MPIDWWSTLACGSWVVSCAIGVGLLDEVDEGEDHDPDDVDEVPVQRGEVDVDRVLRPEPASVVDREQGEEPENPGGHVGPVKAGEGEEGAAEQVGADRQPLVDERGELVRLEAK